jgi:N-formylglutamate amidohydrolase
MRNIILNIPHSSINGIFDNEIGGWERNPFFINDCVNKLTDWHTDFIFKTSNPLVRSVVFPYSRFVCDVERLENDAMEDIGQGIIYTHFNNYKREITDTKTLYKLREFHLQELIKGIKDNDVIIDCHSFSNTSNSCDICIGFNDDFSYDEEIINIVVDEFKKSGYSVGINTPYSNSITPKSDVKYKSVMIEVNKRIYMNENTLQLSSNPRQWIRWFNTIDRIYKRITDC